MKQNDADTLKTRPTLLSKVRRGDEAGWQRFYELYENFIYSAARSTGLTHEDANDVVQDTMITVQNYITSFVPDENRGKFRTWLRRIVQSRIADQYRRKKRSPLDRVRRGAQARADETATSPTNRIPDPTDLEMDRLIGQKLEEVLAEEARNRTKELVRMEDYQAYELFALHELSAKDVGASLGISPATVRVRAFRVRRIVQRELRKICRLLEQPNHSGPAQS